MKGLDTSILIRYLVQDDPIQSPLLPPPHYLRTVRGSDFSCSRSPQRLPLEIRKAPFSLIANGAFSLCGPGRTFCAF